jgi:hypothetical protein
MVDVYYWLVHMMYLCNSLYVCVEKYGYMAIRVVVCEHVCASNV